MSCPAPDLFLFIMNALIGKDNLTWMILYRKEKTSETQAFFLDVATTGDTQVKVNNDLMSLSCKKYTPIKD